MVRAEQVPEPQVLGVQVVDALPALLNLYLVFAPSAGTVMVRVHEGEAVTVCEEPSAEIVVEETLHPANVIVVEGPELATVIVIGWATASLSTMRSECPFIAAVAQAAVS